MRAAMGCLRALRGGTATNAMVRLTVCVGAGILVPALDSGVEEVSCGPLDQDREVRPQVRALESEDDLGEASPHNLCA